MFENAITHDPDYALAYAGLANLYNSFAFDIASDVLTLELQQKYIDEAL